MLYVALDAPDVDIRLEESTSQGCSGMVLLHDGHQADPGSQVCG